MATRYPSSALPRDWQNEPQVFAELFVRGPNETLQTQLVPYNGSLFHLDIIGRLCSDLVTFMTENKNDYPQLYGILTEQHGVAISPEQWSLALNQAGLFIIKVDTILRPNYEYISIHFFRRLYETMLSHSDTDKVIYAFQSLSALATKYNSPSATVAPLPNPISYYYVPPVNESITKAEVTPMDQLRIYSTQATPRDTLTALEAKMKDAIKKSIEDRLAAKIKEVNEKKAAKNAELQAKQNTLVNQAGALAVENKELAKEVAEENKQLKTLQKEKKAEETQIAELTKAINKNKTQIDKLTTKAEEDKATLERVTNERNALLAEKEAAKEAKAKETKDLKDAKKDLEGEKTQLKKVKKEEKKTVEAIKDAEKKTKAGGKTLESLEADITKNNEKITELTNEANKLKGELATATTERDNLKKEKKDETTKLTTAIKENATLQTKLTDLESKSKKAETAIETTTQKLAALEGERQAIVGLKEQAEKDKQAAKDEKIKVEGEAKTAIDEARRKAREEAEKQIADAKSKQSAAEEKFIEANKMLINLLRVMTQNIYTWFDEKIEDPELTTTVNPFIIGLTLDKEETRKNISKLTESMGVTLGTKLSAKITECNLPKLIVQCIKDKKITLLSYIESKSPPLPLPDVSVVIPPPPTPVAVTPTPTPAAVTPPPSIVGTKRKILPVNEKTEPARKIAAVAVSGAAVSVSPEDLAFTVPSLYQFIKKTRESTK